MNNVTGFQRMRRLKAAQQALEATERLSEANTQDIQDGAQGEQQGDGVAKLVELEDEPAVLGKTYTAEAEPLNDPPGSLTVSDVDSLRVSEVKRHLDKLEIKYSHNTGEAKLKERLKNAIS